MAAVKKKKKAVKRRSAKKPSLEKKIDDFGEEVERLGRHFEHEAKAGEKSLARHWHSTFGFLGPLITSIFGIVLFIVFLWFLGFFAFATNTAFLLSVRYFLASNLGVFFLLFLAFSYADYFHRINPRAYRPLWPIIAAAKFTAAIWVIASVIVFSGISCGMPFFRDSAVFALNELFWLFVFIAALGYLVLALSPEHGREREEIKMASASRQRKGGIKRIYRSGRDKVLGGVCGGIAEYLGVDPVIIRLLWVVGTLVSLGTGIILYIIAWVIIPRNPNDEWK